MGRLQFVLPAVAGGLAIVVALLVLRGFSSVILFDPGPWFWNGGYTLGETLAGLLANALQAIAPVIGGATAGYLQRGGPKAGAKIGAVSGALAWIPTILVFMVIWASMFGFFVDVAYFSLSTAGIGTVVVFGLGTANLVGGAALGGYLAASRSEDDVGVK